MKSWHLLLSASAVALISHSAFAQQGAQLPPVDVIQQQGAPKPKPQSSAPKPPQPAAQAPAPAAQPDFVEAPVSAGPSGGRDPVDGRVSSTAAPVTSPVNPSSLLPKDTQNVGSGATRVDRAQIDEERPLTVHEAIVNVPGVVTVNDDGLSRHGGIGIRGSNFRRSRKVLNLEDGQSINFTSYIDPSTHYTPPLDRIENIEILRGTIVSHGPLNNHGIVNFQNLNPFGQTETVIKGALSYTEDADKEWGNQRHVHTRQNLGNVGAVVSYSGADASGAWDNERLRFNDIYGAIGWRDSQQDLTFSGMHFSQRDDYDEDNFVGTLGQFFANARNKAGAIDETESRFNTYNADYWRLQLAHNYYFNDDTTLSTRIYGSDHERNRYSSRDGGPLAIPDDGHMRGRVRDFQVFGVDSRVEFANVPLFAGMTQDIQIGGRYEYQHHRRCTSFGGVGEVLDNNNSGNCRASTFFGDPDDGELDEFQANSFAGYVQSAMHVTRNFTITPGVRFESYEVEVDQIFRGDLTEDLEDASTRIEEVLPGVAMAWEFMPRTTLYGGYHRGIAPHNVAEGSFPALVDIGDNFELGLRSTALTGLTFDIAYFHSFIEDYQIKEGFTDDTGNSIYGVLDEVQFNGLELAVRADSRPITGGSWNLFGQASYTYTNSNIETGRDAVFEDLPTVDVSGNEVPFTVKHFASLTVGVAYEKTWDASLTYTYRGAYFSNSHNSAGLVCIDENGDVDNGCVDRNGAGLDELVGGKVDDVWLLSARANYHVSDELSLFAAGYNLTDELYVVDVQDGLKPGQGRTLLGGFTLKFD
ncbi:MAG: TonB-dependent receptor [Hyphomicrobiaceae bacterium]|nr:TonB-dependent receptor [Hyphomicrobiaceae bacterium]